MKMTHTNKDPKDPKMEKFYTRLISDDESRYVDTDYTIGELEETLDTLTNSAIYLGNPLALKVVSLFAFVTKQFEESVKERSIAQARFEAFRKSVQEIQQLPSKDVKEALGSLLEIDEELSEFLAGIDGLL